MARYGKILLMAALIAFLLTDIEGVSSFVPGNRAAQGTAIATEATGSSVTGITITRPVPSVSESLSDVQARAPNFEEPPPRDRHIRRHRIPRSGDTGTFSPTLSLRLSQAAPVSDAPASMAPAVDTMFRGLINADRTSVAGDVIPPDTMGAAGPGHLVSLLNSQFAVFDKTTGLLQNSIVTLEQFWSSLDPATGNASRFAFDPKILYDTNNQRFVAVTLSAHGPPSWILIAVSSTSDPSGPNPWVKVAIDADEDADNVVRNNWADYPGLGVDANNIYITANMFDNTANSQFRYSKVWVIPINQLLNGEPATLTWTEIREPPASGDSIQPAHTFGFEPGGAPAEYLIREAGSNTLRLARITDGTTWTDLGTISVASFVSSDLPGAPQFGDARGIDTGDTRLLSAAFRNGSLWAIHNVLGPSGKVEVAWYRITPGSRTLAAQGRITDPTRWFYYPSIGVNQNNDIAIGFSGSSASEYVSAYYTAQSSTGSAAGVMQPPSLLKTGVASYYKAGITFGGTDTDNRWGDFSATVVDPTDNVTFWTLQEYAETPAVVSGQSRSMWGTWWGRFQAPAIAAPSLSAAAVSTTQVDLSWTMPAAQGQTGFRVERRQLPGGNFGEISPNLDSATFVYTDNTGMAGTTYSYRVRAFSPTPPDSYSNEATAVTVSPPVTSGGGGGGGCTISSGASRESDVSPLTTVLILLSPIGLMGIRKYVMRHSR